MSRLYILAACALVVGSLATSSQGGAGRPPGVTANVFVAAGGNDSGAACRRFDPPLPSPEPSAACRSIGRGLALAHAGDVVQLLPGSYGDLSISRSSGSLSPKVIVRGDPQLPAEAKCAVGCRPGNVIVDFVTICGYGLSIRNIDTSSQAAGFYVGDQRCPGGNQVQANHDIELANVHFARGTLRGHDLVLRDSRIGPNTGICQSPTGAGDWEDNLRIWPDPSTRPWTVPADVLVEGNLIYDADLLDAKGAYWPRCGSANPHADLIQTLGYNRLTLTHNVFWHCVHSFMQDGVINGTTVGSAQISGNFFGMCPHTGGGYAHLGNADPGGPCSGRYVIANNTWVAAGSFTLSCTNAQALGNVWRNNYLHESAGIDTTCGSGIWDHNVFPQDGATCGTHTKRCEPKFRYAASGSDDLSHGWDLHLAAADRCLRSGGAAARSPTSDLDGDLRPSGAPPDIGADQYETAAIVMGRGIGRIVLGDRVDELTRAYGTARQSTRRLTPGGITARVATFNVRGGILWAALRRSVVVGVGTTSPYYTTASGLSVGTPRAAVRRTLDGRWLRCRSEFVRRTGSTITRIAAKARVTSIAVTPAAAATPLRCDP